MKKLIPVLLLVIGMAAGAGVGWVLRPKPAAAPEAAQPPAAAGGGHGADAQAPAAAENAAHAAASATGNYAPAPANIETVRLPNQFVVPVIVDGRVVSLVVIGLALELEPGSGFSLSDSEPRLRAVFLQLLFDHANIGGFTGIFTSGESLLALRRILREAGRAEIGPALYDVLITELVRQDS